MTHKIILAADVVKEINEIDCLSADVYDDTIVIHHIHNEWHQHNDPVADVIAEVYRNERLKLIDGDESASVAMYTLRGLPDEIWEPCDGGIVVFRTADDRNVWLNQI